MTDFSVFQWYRCPNFFYGMDLMFCERVKTMYSSRISASSFKFLNFIRVSIAPVSNKKLLFLFFFVWIASLSLNPCLSVIYSFICVTSYSRADCDVSVFNISSLLLLLNEKSEFSFCFFFFLSGLTSIYYLCLAFLQWVQYFSIVFTPVCLSAFGRANLFAYWPIFPHW